jgi:hypothetical protein
MEQEELMATGVYDHRSSLHSLKRAAIVPSWWAVAVLSWDHVMHGRTVLLVGPLELLAEPLLLRSGLLPQPGNTTLVHRARNIAKR